MIYVPLNAGAQEINEEIKGRVIGITDGDTLSFMSESQEKLKIRLAEIDTPEKGQPFGQKSKDTLSHLAFNKQASIEKLDVDRYGRIVARVYVEQDDAKPLNVNKTMVASGAAWVYRQYLRDESLLELEALAKEEKRGLWALPEAQKIPPWEWRKRSQEELNKDHKPSSSDKSGALFKPLPQGETYEHSKTTVTIPGKSFQSTVSSAARISTPARSCCKYCKKGKPCGDSCINRSYTCRKRKGCAC